MSSVLHVFSVTLGVKLNKFLAEVFCVMYAGGG